MFILRLTLDQINLLGRALGNMPYGQVAALINEVTRQIEAQQRSQQNEKTASQGE